MVHVRREDILFILPSEPIAATINNIFRGNRIFAIRLPGAYMFFMSVFVVPSVIYAVRFKVQKTLYSGFMLYLFLMYFNFSRGNGVGGNFTTDRYKNHLWLK